MQLLQRLSAADGMPERDPEVQSQRAEAVRILTERELEVLGLLSQGHTNGQIAKELVLSVGTVKTHVHRIISKLGVSDRTQAAVRAIRIGLVSVNP